MRIELRKMIDPSRVHKNTPAAWRARNPMSDEEWFAVQKSAAEAQMAETDALPKAARLLVHEYGLNAVRRWLRQGSLSEVLRALAQTNAPDLDI